jgi:hypothetical protein
MLAIAAVIEGFWSPSGAPARVMYGTAIAAYTLVISYLSFAGRAGRRRAAPVAAPVAEARP